MLIANYYSLHRIHIYDAKPLRNWSFTNLAINNLPASNRHLWYGSVIKVVIQVNFWYTPLPEVGWRR